MSKTMVITRLEDKKNFAVRYHAEVHLEVVNVAELEAQEPNIRQWTADIMLERLKREIQDFDTVEIREIYER